MAIRGESMVPYTPHQARYFAEQITLQRSKSSYEGLVSAMSGAKVDLTPHQVDAAYFALKSPLSSGALLADEVGLGKTIEAGIVLAQYWSERKYRILLIMPASLRMQWRAELSEKFYIPSVIMESTLFNKRIKEGVRNPFVVDKQVVICSYDFASRKKREIGDVNWDLVVFDEAHKLRNVYKKGNVIGNNLKEALKGRKKILLTATPLQNNLMELYGLTSMIDSQVFGDAKSFHDMFISCANQDVRNHILRERLQNFCIRTLRKQAQGYVNYTNRIPILQEYSPTPEEQMLYDGISEYLQTTELYALPPGQRNLITMVVRKLLASSSYAINGTLESLITRLEGLLDGVEKELDMDDFDSLSEYEEDDEGSNGDEILANDSTTRRTGIQAEIELLRGFADLAKSIKKNSKGDNLLLALEKGFKKMEELGGQRKAVIFTESRRTQDYLYKLLSNAGYAGQIVFLNGMNNDADSKAIYSRWKERHSSDGVISGSKQADMKAAMVEAFRDEACILIGTEAASEGINLQFCSIVVNYDLPWNPQRIEQRIGRCHRYGQKNDVVVINFLNNKNAADKRVYDLLDQKFKLFDGVFGSSDEILGSLESGVDFERRIAGIYQQCKHADEIQRAFDELRDELSDEIEEGMLTARKSILENFDEDVARRLIKCQETTTASLNKFQQWMYYFFLIRGGDNAVSLNDDRLRLVHADGTVSTYNLKWQNAEAERDVFLRRDEGFFGKWLKDTLKGHLDPVTIQFDNTNAGERKIYFFQNYPGLRGVLSIDKLVYSGNNGADVQEHLIFTVETSGGIPVDDETINRMLELSGVIVDGVIPAESESLIRLRDERIDAQKRIVENENTEHYIAECLKLDAYYEDLKNGLEREIKELGKRISELQRTFKTSRCEKLDEMVRMQDEIKKLKATRKRKQREMYDEQDRLDNENEQLQMETRKKLDGKMSTEHVMTIGFEIV